MIKVEEKRRGLQYFPQVYKIFPQSSETSAPAGWCLLEVMFQLCSTKLLKFIFLFFYWKKIALQHCVGFCYTTMQISHNYIHIHIYMYIYPLHPSQLQTGLPVSYNSFSLAICFTHAHVYIYVNAIFPVCPILCFPCHKIILCFLHGNRFNNTLFLDSIYMF